ncbi:MAG: PAS domain-containing sensor histidine kinase [Bacteroidetes bacterium]|nr:PAS domain-containing sensor histidine kinase [Bacteroidota bacterium]
MKIIVLLFLLSGAIFANNSPELPISKMLEIESGNFTSDSLISLSQLDKDYKIYRLEQSLEDESDKIIYLVSVLILVLAFAAILFYIHNKNKKLSNRYLLQNRQLESVNKLFTNFLDQSVEAFTLFDSRGEILLWNPANEQITGIKQEEAIGESVWEIGSRMNLLSFGRTRESERIRLEKFFTKMINDPEFRSKTDELMVENKSGEVKTIEVSYFPIIISHVKYFGIITLNITERKEYEGQLIIAKDKAESSDRLKTEFLAQISHEIRTPINTILNNTSILEYEFENTISSEAKSSVSSIQNAGRRIVRTVDLLINISALQAGTYDYKSAYSDLYAEILEPCSREFENLAKEKDLILTLNKNSEKFSILVDLYSLQLVVKNLIENAIIFTEKGSVTIDYGKDEYGRIFFKVTDTGIGISEEFIPNLFEPFSQEEQGYTRRYEGNGLGLTLVQKFCELNDAEIIVKSTKGEGSSFTILFGKMGINEALKTLEEFSFQLPSFMDKD